MSTAARAGIGPSSRVARSGAIVFSSFDDATVMMDAEIGRYYEINPVGARIWGLAESAPQVAEVLEVLAAEAARAEVDVLHAGCRAAARACAAPVAPDGKPEQRCWRCSFAAPGAVALAATEPPFGGTTFTGRDL